jgi:hypothetical protein
MGKSFVLKLTSAIAVDGEVVAAGGLVEVDEPTAKNLLHRGKAVLATAEDGVEDDGDDPDLSKLNKAQLVALAAELGVITVGDSNTKAEILAAIEAAKKDQAE